jgi:hypothetical protein
MTSQTQTEPTPAELNESYNRKASHFFRWPRPLPDDGTKKASDDDLGEVPRTEDEMVRANEEGPCRSNVSIEDCVDSPAHAPEGAFRDDAAEFRKKMTDGSFVAKEYVRYPDGSGVKIERRPIETTSSVSDSDRKPSGFTEHYSKLLAMSEDRKEGGGDAHVHFKDADGKTGCSVMNLTQEAVVPFLEKFSNGSREERRTISLKRCDFEAFLLTFAVEKVSGCYLKYVLETLLPFLDKNPAYRDPSLNLPDVNFSY